MSGRYLKVVLTVIVLELAWIAVNGLPQQTFAQSAATPVVITGVRSDDGTDGSLPVVVRGAVTISPNAPVTIVADRPLPVESVPFTPSLRPGEASSSLKR
jgi:hypothetical protein